MSVTITPNHKVKPEIKKLKLPKINPVKTDSNKALEILKDDVLDVVETNKELLVSVPTITTENG